MVGGSLALLVASVAWASDPVLRLSAEPPSLLVGQTGTVTVSVQIEGGGNVGLANGRTPAVPADDALALRYRGTSQRFSATGARIVSVFSYQFGVDALMEGTWTVGPASVVLSDGTVLQSKPVTIEVRPRSGDDPGAEAAFQVRAGFEAETAWEGQLLIYEYVLETTHPGVRAGWRLPPFDGFRQPQHGVPEETTYQVQDGDVVITTVHGRVPLIAVGTGSLSVPPALATVETFGVNRTGWAPRKEERRATAPDTVTVKRLPPPPPDFSGLVGEVEVEARLEKDRAAVGESVGLQILLQSTGSVEGLQLAAYDAEGFSVYDETAHVTGRLADGRYVGVGSFRRVLVPVEPGEHALPPVRVVTFSPARGDYVVHEVEVGALTATPGREGSGQIESFGVVAEESPPEAPVLLQEPWSWGPASTPRLGLLVPLLAVGASAPGTAVLAGRGLAALRRRWRERVVARAGPPSPFLHLRGLPEGSDARLQAYDLALRQALANREGVALGALDRDAAVEGLPPELRRDVEKLFDGLGRARYGGGGATDALDGVVRRVLSALEKA